MGRTRSTSGLVNRKLSSRMSNSVSNPNLTAMETAMKSVGSPLRNEGEYAPPSPHRLDSPLLHSSSGAPDLRTSYNDIRTPPMHPNPPTERPVAMPPGTKEANAEVYGFVGWVVSFFVFSIYLIWAYVPDHFLHQMGISYYPDKWWAIAFPTQMCVSVLSLMWIIYLSINLMNTPPLHSRQYYTPDEEGKEAHTSLPGGIDPISDLPLTTVNRFLYRSEFRKHRKSRSSQLFQEQ